VRFMSLGRALLMEVLFGGFPALHAD